MSPGEDYRVKLTPRAAYAVESTELAGADDPASYSPFESTFPGSPGWPGFPPPSEINVGLVDPLSPKTGNPDAVNVSGTVTVSPFRVEWGRLNTDGALAGVKLSVWRVDGDGRTRARNVDGSEAPLAVTDANGAFELPDLAPLTGTSAWYVVRLDRENNPAAEGYGIVHGFAPPREQRLVSDAAGTFSTHRFLLSTEPFTFSYALRDLPDGFSGTPLIELAKADGSPYLDADGAPIRVWPDTDVSVPRDCDGPTYVRVIQPAGYQLEDVDDPSVTVPGAGLQLTQPCDARRVATFTLVR